MTKWNLARVSIYPLRGQRIKIKVHGKVFCSRLNQEIRNSQVLDKSDQRCLDILGGHRRVQRFLNRNKNVVKVTDLSFLGYDTCDRVR